MQDPCHFSPPPRHTHTHCVNTYMHLTIVAAPPAPPPSNSTPPAGFGQRRIKRTLTRLQRQQKIIAAQNAALAQHQALMEGTPYGTPHGSPKSTDAADSAFGPGGSGGSGGPGGAHEMQTWVVWNCCELKFVHSKMWWKRGLAQPVAQVCRYPVGHVGSIYGETCRTCSSSRLVLTGGNMFRLTFCHRYASATCILSSSPGTVVL